MNCPACGAPVEGAFCSRCGARLQPPATPFTPQAAGYTAPQAPQVAGYPAATQPYGWYAPRVSGHIQTLGILWLVYGGYRIVGGVFAALFLTGIARHGFLDRFGGDGFPFAPIAPFMGGLAAFVLIMTFFGSILAFITGYALLTRKPWGRVLAIVAAVLALFKIFLGTALGIYTLWVLAPSTSGHEYQALSNE